MYKESLPDIAQIYFRRFSDRPTLIHTPPQPETKIIIVIPCYDEPDLLKTLCSLAQCQASQYPVEVIVVINAHAGADPLIMQRNRQAYEQAAHWLGVQQHLPYQCHLLKMDDLPSKHAGVGLARKIGMDEALRRFAGIGFPGWIVCLDADCTVSHNYLIAIEKECMATLPKAFTIYFEHDLNSQPQPDLRQGIVYYELFLRYYVNALRYSGFPFAMHTIGSSMAVRADIYAKVGGMNRRKAGEDFYFLHKVAPQGDFLQINQTVVYPSSRISYRVPFGTGKAQAEWQHNREKRLKTYHLQIFEELKQFLSQVDLYYTQTQSQIPALVDSLPPAVKAFLWQQDFEHSIEEIKNNTTHLHSFRKRFFHWFDGFKVLKYVHFARDHFYPVIHLTEAAHLLAEKVTQETYPEDEETLLHFYRQLDR